LFGTEETALSYKMQYNVVKQTMREVGVTSNEVTHIGRNIAVRDAALAGCQEGAMKRLGRWANGSMDGSYLNSVLPMEGKSTITGIEIYQGKV
jgi:hypothetical protein